jgi:hypothetical protein
MRICFLLYSLIFIVFANNLDGQFYNGHQMQFGKNRVQYNSFYWTYYRYDRFDTYFNEYGKEFARYTGDFASKELDRLESFFDYRLDNRIIFIIYNKLTDFRQSNIGLVTGNNESNIGGTIQIDRNKVFLYFEGDYKKFEEQITARICQVIISEMIYGNGLRDNATNSTLINLPEWYINGLISYISKGCDFEYENRIKDGILSARYKKFNRLQGDDAKFAGHSFWQYIVETYGESIIPNILYLTKINKNANTGLFYAVGFPLKELSRNWYSTYYDLYSKQDKNTNFPDYSPLIKKPNRKKVYQQLKLNPSGNSVAYVTNQMGKYQVWYYDLNTGKRKKLISREHKLEQITDYSFPVLAWYPSGRILTFITEEKGGLRYYYYTVGSKEVTWQNMLYFEKVLSYSFSPDGSQMVLSAVKDGQTDIYVHNIAAGTNFQVTNDIADDFDPRFINNEASIIFSSNRAVDSINSGTLKLKTGYTTDLFIYDYQNHSPLLKRLADANFIDKSQPYEFQPNKYISLSDKNGIVNRYISKFDSTIISVDTIVHYRYLAETEPNTNYPRNIIEQDYNRKSNKLSEIVFNKGRFYMFSHDFDKQELDPKSIEPTTFRRIQTKRLAEKDSISNIEVVTIPIDSITNNKIFVGNDSLTYEPGKIDINNYVFEAERIKMINEALKDKNINIALVEKKDQQLPKARIYQKAFYQNYLVSQIDFSFLSNSYQAFTGGAVYFQPGTNVLLKVGTYDLFEDYKLTAGIRLPLDFQSSEYLIGIEDLKTKTDKQLFLHRQTYFLSTESGYFYVKNVTNDATLTLRYPHSQVSGVNYSVCLRNDKLIWIPSAYDSKTLGFKDTTRLWVSQKAEYVFDNTRTLGLNLPAGTRLKFFGEMYQQVNKGYYNLFVLGADIRNYTVIHRNFIWANRFAASASFGSSKLIYYLGGVDNWTNFSQKTPTFIPLSEIGLTPGVHYKFQTVATNLRGFSQNIRNGSNFALFNSELRLPIIRYLANYPLSNAFFENFQIAGFFDIGTAWSGFSPWSKKNGYDKDYVYSGTTEIEIDAQRDPIVAGYGFGLRSQFLGYFIRLDWAWGIENYQVLPRVFYFSLSLDF